MNKYTIIGVIVLMSISLLGVVGLQVYWINDAIRVKQAQFDSNVNNALQSAVDKLETQEAVSVVVNEMEAWQQPIVTDTLPDKTIVTPKEKKNKPAPAKAKPTIKPKPAIVKQPEKRTAAIPKNEIVWIKDTPLVPGKFYTLRNGQPWIRLASGDSIPFRDHTIAGLSPIRYKDIYQIHDIPDGKRLHVYTSQKEAVKLIRKSAANKAERARDSMAFSLKGDKISFSFSLDTLRLLASKLDSLHQFNRIPATINAPEFTAVEVRNDSLYLYEKGKKKPVYVSHVGKTNPATSMGYGPQKDAFKYIVRSGISETVTHTDKKPLKPDNKAQKKETIATTKESAKAPKPTQEKKTPTEKLEHKKEKLNDVVQKMVVEYVAKDEPLQKRLNLHNLQNLLTDELKKQGITLPFGYHVVSGASDTVAVRKAGQPTEDTHYYATFLFPNDIIEKPDYLAIYFPDTKFHAISSLAGMMALSGLFTLIIIATFGTTIHIIYKQKKLSEMKNDFINNMTHEFKTPIATISLATDSIANPKVYEHPEKIKYYTNIIRQENKRMNSQVENVLQIALLEKNEFRMKLEPVDVHQLIVRAIESIQLQVEQRLGQINVQLDAFKHELRSDEVHLYNVICNLLDNANKYSPASPEINLSTRNVAGGILIAVDDKGMGMSKDTQQRVFEKFYRVPTGNLHNVKGFGLGLSYVKAIVQAHHGNIKLWSEPGKGSRFEIFLPISEIS